MAGRRPGERPRRWLRELRSLGKAERLVRGPGTRTRRADHHKRLRAGSLGRASASDEQQLARDLERRARWQLSSRPSRLRKCSTLGCLPGPTAPGAAPGRHAAEVERDATGARLPLSTSPAERRRRPCADAAVGIRASLTSLRPAPPRPTPACLHQRPEGALQRGWRGRPGKTCGSQVHTLSEEGKRGEEGTSAGVQVNMAGGPGCEPAYRHGVTMGRRCNIHGA